VTVAGHPRIFEHTPTVVGHRGAGQLESSGLPDNSVESCLAAQAQGAGWVEIDARLTLDAELVLHHDPTLPDGRAVDETTLADCRAQGLTGFDELLDALPDGLGVDLEVKVALGDATASAASSTAGRVAARAVEVRDRRPVVVTSFSAAALLQAREVAADVPVGLLSMPFTGLRELVPSAVALGAAVIAPHVATMGVLDIAGLPRESTDRIREALATAREHGCETLVWGVRPPQVPDLIGLGVEAVCVDDIPGTLAATARP
jgi:glycerophosphoryl diester phosphodiesterase